MAQLRQMGALMLRRPPQFNASRGKADDAGFCKDGAKRWLPCGAHATATLGDRSGFTRSSIRARRHARFDFDQLSGSAPAQARHF